MTDKTINRLVALGVFLAAAVVYLRTLSVTVVFWDVGEFCAAAFLLQVPHPPGSPLFILLARIASMVPYFTDIAARMHAVSAVTSAFSIAFFYFIGVKIIKRYRGAPETAFDRVILYGSAAIGALALAYSSTYWDNSIEAEVYGLAMFFVALIIWLALRWWEQAEEPHNEKYMMLIAYLAGLSVGVHLLSLLTIFSVLMIIYFRLYEVTRQSLIRFALAGLAVFLVIYPGIVQFMPSLLDGEFKGIRSEIFPFIPFILIIAAAYGAYRTVETKQKLMHMACLSFLLIVLGYTTYIIVLKRSQVTNLPMNENNPSNLSRLTSYLTREQYGDTPQLKGESWNNEQGAYVDKLFPRRWSREPMHEPTRTNYTSDGDFFLRYQVYHMYVRYLLWNFVGAEGDWQDAGVSWKDTWGIPLIMGLFGLYYHFKKDWKMASVFLVMFTIMGIVLDLYQNQQDPQPRERDYFYVGAYFCIALWIMVGITGIIDFLRNKITQVGSYRAAASGVLLLSAAAIPFNLARVNWHEHDRSQEYIAWDYSYNILQSCEKDGILFTNGDNDTFPLWYLQDVEGIRRDIRIVNLSLVNTSWYLLQLKNETPHGAKKVPISFNNQQIERIQPQAWKTRSVDIPVTRDAAERFLAEERLKKTKGSEPDTAILHQGKISFTFSGVPYQGDVRVLRIQDIMVRDIIMANRWERPIYFAVTCSPDSKIGLDAFLWMQGLTYRLKPLKISATDGGIDYDIMAENMLAKDASASKTPQNGYLYRNLNNPSVYYDENVQRMVMNYRFAFMRLAEHALKVQNNIPAAREVLAEMESAVPISVIPIQERNVAAYIMNIYSQVGDSLHFESYAQDLEKKALDALNANSYDPQDPWPYRLLLSIYDVRKNYPAAVDLLNRALSQFPNTPELKSQIDYYQQKAKGTMVADSNKQK